MSDSRIVDVFQHIVDQLPAIITAIGGTWAVIHSTNKKTIKEARITNAKVDEVQKGVNGNLQELNSRLDRATGKIEALHDKIEVTAAKTEVDKAVALKAAESPPEK